MGYDMYAIAGTGDRGRDYFRLNVWGMGKACDLMWDFDMLAEPSPAHSPWPDHPDGEWVEEEDAQPGTPWGDYYAAQRGVLAEHLNRDDPRLPIHKLCSNDGWIVTEVECRTLAGMANDGRTDGHELPEWWKEWIDFIDHCATHGGFRVW